MKKLNRKTVFCGLMMPFWVKAGLLVIIGFIVFVGVLIYLGVKLHYYFSTIHPHNQNTTNNLAQVQLEPIGSAPYPAIATLQSTNLVPARTMDCVIVYGMPGPWIKAGAKAEMLALQAAAEAPDPFVTVDTESEYAFYLDFAGQWYYFSSMLMTNTDCYTINDDGAVENGCLITNIDGTVTDGSLFWVNGALLIDSPPEEVMTLLAKEKATLYTNVVERTPDFKLGQWTPIYTNLYVPGNVSQLFIDTNAPWPNAFYRVVAY